MVYIFLSMIIFVLIIRVMMDYKDYQSSKARKGQLESELVDLKLNIDQLKIKMKKDKGRFQKDMSRLLEQYQSDMKRFKSKKARSIQQQKTVVEHRPLPNSSSSTDHDQEIKS